MYEEAQSPKKSSPDRGGGSPHNNSPPAAGANTGNSRNAYAPMRNN